MDHRSILGIESTCDETAAAVVIEGRTILSNVVASQIETHRPFGGVVPELASRTHLELIQPVVQQALDEANTPIDAIAVAQGPGLLGSLLVGINMAKGLALGWNKPLIPVNHVEAHLYAAMMGRQEEIPFPALGVVVSGGHTALLQINSINDYALLGATVDDAIGEAFDKVASMLGLPYPGGPAIESLAEGGDPNRYPFHPGHVKASPLAFSFSGLKTNVLYTLREPHHPPDIAASFQRAATDDILSKSRLAATQINAQSIILGGGVCNNQTLKNKFANLDLPIFWPPPPLTLDNAAMIAGLAYEKQPGPLTFSPEPRLKPFWVK
jgi:tRNA N6-adenosine threonylcarbamoyltransferase